MQFLFFMLYKKIIILFSIILIFHGANSQTNLVPNWSFEDLLVCPSADFTPVYQSAFPWYSPTGGTPDIYNVCCNSAPNHDSVTGVPHNGLGYQQAHTGNGYGGFAWDYSSNCEYLSVKLISLLEAGKKYCVQFYVNPANYTYYVIDRIGAYLSVDSINEATYGYLHYIPQIESPAGIAISDTVNWTEISGIYTAAGGEQFITIGCFRPDSMVYITYNDTIHPPGYWPYYNIDDVSVYYCDTIYKAEAGTNKTICEGDSVQIGLPPNADCYYKWQPAISLSNDSIANPWVKPAVTTTYYLQQTFMSNITTDSVKVIVISCEDTLKNSLTIPNAFTPNGDGYNDYFKVNGTNIKSLTGKIFNRWGEELFKFTDANSKWDGKYKGKDVSAGTYFYIINVVFNDDSTESKHGCIELVR